MKTFRNIFKSNTRRALLAAGVAVLFTMQIRAWTGAGTLLSFQTAALDYGATRYYYPGYGETLGPQPYFDVSRVNDGVIIYAFDPTFIQYFGQDGRNAVNAAFAVLNGLPYFKGNSPNLANYPTQGTQRVNYTAQALNLMDLKSTVLGILVRQLGLMGETHVFDLEGRYAIPAPAPAGEYYYQVIERNYDPANLVNPSPSTFVNGSQYGFEIFDNGTDADAIEFFNNTRVLPFDTVAVATEEGQVMGGYYVGLSRDDVGGLRYLYNEQRFANETFDTTCYPGPFNTGNTAFGGGSSSSTTTTSTNTGTTTTTTGGTYILGGVGHITFAEVPYSSVIGTTYGTNVAVFNIPGETNGQFGSYQVYRTNTAPDIVFAAADLTANGDANAPPTELAYTYTLTMLGTVAAPNGNGTLPGVISVTSLITLNDASPIFLNYSPSFLTDDTSIPYWNWATYNASTNIIVYPQTSLATLLQQASTTAGIPTAFGGSSTNTVATPIIVQSP